MARVTIYRVSNRHPCGGMGREGSVVRDRVQLAVVGCAVLLQAAFGGSLFHAQSPSDVAIRIENASDKNFDGVLVKFPSGQQENYGRIPAASSSPYRTVA